MRKIAGTLLAVVIAVAGVIGLIAFFNGRDSSTTSRSATTPAASVGNGPSDGNVVLTFSDPSFEPKLLALAEGLGAKDTPALRQAGQAVIVRRDPQAGGVVAQAAGHKLVVTGPDSPGLQDFIDRWLGQGASG